MMRLGLTLGGAHYRIRINAPVSLAIPLDFDGPQPSFFGAPRAAAAPVELPGFIGDTRQGGSCNVRELRLVPHCNGTHTETVGHIVREAVYVGEALAQTLFPARLITVAPCGAGETDEGGGRLKDPEDRVITRRALRERLESVGRAELQALLVRTSPNDASKIHRDYGGKDRPPYFTAEAMAYVVERGVEHLLVDVPSLDPMHDEGRLANHRLFWELAEDQKTLGADVRVHKTVTEMIFVPDDLSDGLYLLDLQVPAFLSDAAPSRPLVYPLEPIDMTTAQYPNIA
jgi:kynurenine formamidase